MMAPEPWFEGSPEARELDQCLGFGPTHPDDGMTCPREGCGQPVPMGSLWLVAGLLYCTQECSKGASDAAKKANHKLEIEAETDAVIPPQRRRTVTP